MQKGIFMGIDVSLCRTDGESFEPDDEFEERVANIDTFLVLAYIFGLTLEPLHQLAQAPPLDEEQQNRLRALVILLDRTIAEHRQEGITHFRRYYEAISQSLRRMKTQGMKPADQVPMVEHLPLEAIAEDAQAFLGWFMLSERAIEPAEAQHFAPLLGLMVSMFTNFAELYAQDNPNLARMMTAARECLTVAGRFCDLAVSHEKPMFFSI